MSDARLSDTEFRVTVRLLHRYAENYLDEWGYWSLPTRFGDEFSLLRREPEPDVPPTMYVDYRPSSTTSVTIDRARTAVLRSP
jgi:hypothetical protein